jgi:arylsulfatase A-like enzyme
MNETRIAPRRSQLFEAPYYLNAIRDEDRALQQIVDVLNEMDLWRDTIVIFTADHGEMGAPTAV